MESGICIVWIFCLTMSDGVVSPIHGNLRKHDLYVIAYYYYVFLHNFSPVCLYVSSITVFENHQTFLVRPMRKTMYEYECVKTK